MTVAWSQLDGRTWTMTTKRDGPPTTVTLSADERTLTIAMSWARQSEHDSFVLTRTAGRSSLIVEWKLTQSNLAVDSSQN